MTWEEKHNDLIKELRRAEEKVDFAASVPSMRFEELIKTEPTVKAAYNQYMRVDSFGVTDFLLTCAKLLYSQKKDVSEKFQEYVEHGPSPVYIVKTEDTPNIKLSTDQK